MHLLIGLTHLMHGRLLWGDLAPLCALWSAFYHLKYILLECPNYDKDCHTFHLQGILHNILGDDRVGYPMLWHSFIVQGLTSLFSI
jgi:hypothetical protein